MDFGGCGLVEEAAQVERRGPGRILMFAHGGDMAALLQMEIICRRRPQRLDLALDRLAALTAFVGRNIDARSGLQGKVMIKQIAHGSRSEEHTSELQSLMRISYAVFCLNKKNTQVNRDHSNNRQRKTQIK